MTNDANPEESREARREARRRRRERPPWEGPKVFCIGMNKTGTSTMKKCFITLGIVPVASPKTMGEVSPAKIFRRIWRKGKYDRLIETARDFASFEDRPWNVWESYQHLDRAYPGSRFILTVREDEAWWGSVHRWLTERKPHIVDTYCQHLRAERFTKEAFLAGYHRYNDAVREYFAGSPNFLEMDIPGGDGWEELCGFLGCPVPDIEFPHLNRQ